MSRLAQVTPRSVMWFAEKGDTEQALMDDARSSESGDSTTEAWTENPEEDEFEAYMFGTVEDKVAIQEAVGDLTEDDLESSSITAAVHMQIHWQTACMRTLKVWCTFGLYLLFLPRESQGVLLLTKKGRVLNIGTSYAADSENVFGYAWRMIFNVIIGACVIYVMFDVVTDEVHVRLKILTGVAGGLVILVVGAMLWGSRPRRDCGADFRQQFNVSDMCVGNYSRVDSWCCCFRRRRGHLRLCFGKLYPDQVTIEENLPVGVPVGIRRLQPASSLSPAYAGDTLECYKEREIEMVRRTKEFKGGNLEGFSPFVAMMLAGLGIVGGFYEFCSVAHTMQTFSQDVCTQKVKGCNWEVPNPENLGQTRTVDHANPPFGYTNALSGTGCDEEGEYCNVYWREIDYCSPNRAKGLSKEVRLRCDDIGLMEQLLHPVLQDGKVTYKTTARNTSITSMAVKGLPNGGEVWLDKGAILDKIGPSSSNESQILAWGSELDWAAVRAHCAQDRTFGKNMLFVFHEESEVVDLQDTDCWQLQQACLAQDFGPDTNGWWPVSHLLHWSKTRTICAFHPDLTQLVTGEVFWHLVESFEPGLTCVGPPKKSFRLAETEDNETTCQRKCLELEGCNFAFYKPLKEPFSAEMWRHSREIWEGMPSDDDNCLLYDECPAWGEKRGNFSLHYDTIECGSSVGAQAVGKRMPVSAVELRLQKPVQSAEECKQNCTGVEKRMCNGFSVVPAGDGMAYCTLYGQPKMSFCLPKSAGWEELPIQTMGQIGMPGQEGECYVKLPPLPSDPDRMRTGTTGQLFRRSELRYCTGCAKHELVAYLFEWQNFMTVLAQVVSIFGFSFILGRSKRAQAWLTNEFSGKPIVDLEIAGDNKNLECFEEREDAYRTFLKMCFTAKRDVEHVGTLGEEKFHKDCWEWEDDDTAMSGQGSVKVEAVAGQTMEDYKLYDSRMQRCFVDKELLGFFPNEKVMGAWPEKARKGLWRLPFVLLFFGLFVYSLEEVLCVLPQRWQENDNLLNTKRTIYFIILASIAGLFYYEYRVGYDCLCVVTNEGRIIHIIRGPPVACASRCYANLGVRIDVFHIGAIILAQVDMAVVAHCLDVIFAWPAKAGRKGKVTIKAAHGFLELHRRSGDALVIFRAMSALMDSTRVSGLPDTPFDENELYGISPQRDIKTREEKHVWTHTFECAGYYTDAFNYTALLTITDHRTIIVRARMPKRLSCRGIFCGPRTFGNCCIWLQDLMHHTPYLTIACLGHNHLQSYASIRKRAPPFWPGLMTPVAGCTVSLLPLYMTTYPSGFAVTQRPYGDSRDLRTTEKVTLNFNSCGKLQVKHSKDPLLTVGRVVDSVNGEQAKDIAAQGLDEVVVEPDSDVVLESASPEWSAMADEAWLCQLRKIYDYIIKRTEQDELILMLERRGAPAQLPSAAILANLNLGDSLLARLVGADMLGHHHQPLSLEEARHPLADMQGRVEQLTDEVSHRVTDQTDQLAASWTRTRWSLTGQADQQGSRDELLQGTHLAPPADLVHGLTAFWLHGDSSDSDSDSDGDSKLSFRPSGSGP